MIRLACLQFRTQALTALAALAALAIVLAATGPQLVHLYGSVASCTTPSECTAATSALTTKFPFVRVLGALAVVGAPALIGIFWGAPLITRELETGTHRLAWTQSITRTRWLAVKLALAGLASIATAGLFSLMVTWWSSPIDRVSMNSFALATFDARGIAPVGYAAFAFALGVTVGAVIRRTLPAMVVTLVIFAAIQGYAMPQLIRPHLIPPAHASTALDIATVSTGSQNGQLWVSEPANIPGAWIYSSKIILPSGQPVSTEPPGACGNSNSPVSACENYIAGLHLRQQVTYQPASRYWAFQWAETGVFLAAAVLLALFCFWWVRRPSTA